MEFVKRQKRPIYINIKYIYCIVLYLIIYNIISTYILYKYVYILIIYMVYIVRLEYNLPVDI
jgi:hypothetical protein